MSKLCDQVVDTLRESFPGMKITRELHVNYEKQRLYIDIWIPQLNLAIEVHGKQHDEFVKHFHGTIEDYWKSNRRDRLKKEWADVNGITYLILRSHELPIDKNRLMEKIRDA